MAHASNDVARRVKIPFIQHKILPRTAPCNGVWTVLGSYPCSDPRARKCTLSPQMVPSKEASIHRHIQRSGLLRHLRPPLPRVLLIPRGRVWTGRARETARGQRATPYPPGQCPHAPGLGGEWLGGHPPLGCTASGEGGRGPRRGAKPPAGTPARTPAFLSLFNLLLLVDALYACYCFIVAFICLLAACAGPQPGWRGA